MHKSLFVRSMVLCLLFAACRAVAAEEQLGVMPPDELDRAATESLMTDYLNALDRLDLKAAKRIARQAATKFPGRPETELMVRHTRLFAAVEKTMTEANQPRQSDNADKDRIYKKTYYVGDLVLPLPVIHNSLGGTPMDGAVFDPLMESISAWIKPHSWVEVDGPGEMLPSVSKLSLVISQTQDVHEEIAYFLEYLRFTGSFCISLDVWIITAPEAALTRLLRNNEVLGRKILDPIKSNQLLNEIKKHDLMSLHREVIIKNGRSVSIPTAVGEDGKVNLYIDVNAVVSNDRRYIRLWAGAGNMFNKANIQLAAGHIVDRKTLCIQFTHEQGKQDMSKNDSALVKPPVVHGLLLLTPRINIPGEEEERLARSYFRPKRLSEKYPAAKYNFQPAVPSYNYE